MVLLPTSAPRMCENDVTCLLLLPSLATFNNLNILPRGGGFAREREKEKERGREKKRKREREGGEREGEKDRHFFREGHYLQWGEDQRRG